MTVQLVKDRSFAGIIDHRELVVVGSVAFHPCRQYPWEGKHGCVVQFFKHKSSAVEFAQTGVAPDEKV